MNNPFQTTTVKEKAIEATHTAQATVQKAKHRVQEISVSHSDRKAHSL